MLRLVISGSERQGLTQVRFPIFVLRSTDGTEWVQVPWAPQEVILDATAILTITNDTALTNGQRIAALADLMKAQVEGYGVTEAEEALGDLAALGISYPVTINL